jgi:hypothetical protein
VKARIGVAVAAACALACPLALRPSGCRRGGGIAKSGEEGKGSRGERLPAKERKLAVARVEVRLASDGVKLPAGVDEARIEALARARLSRERGLELRAAPKAAALTVEILARVGRLESGQDRRGVAALARARGAALPEGLSLQANALVQLGDKSPPLAEAVEKAVGLALDDLLFQLRLATGPEDAIVRALSEKDLERLSSAIDIAAVRRAKGAVPALVALLRSKEEEISDRAIGALGAIGDRRAVKPLTRLVEFKDTTRLAKVLDVIGSLGGDEAQNFLEFVASGHDDADIRNMAREALDRMQKSAKKITKLKEDAE